MTACFEVLDLNAFMIGNTKCVVYSVWVYLHHLGDALFPRKNISNSIVCIRIISIHASINHQIEINKIHDPFYRPTVVACLYVG